MKCEICGKECKSFVSLSGHITKKHGIKSEDYYIKYLKKDIVKFLICQRPEEQGYNAINKLFRNVVQKRKIEKENYSSIDIITKENVNYYKEFK